MWARGIQLLDQDEPGFWESLGYHNYGDPWQKQRFWGTETEVVLTSSDLWGDGNALAAPSMTSSASRSAPPSGAAPGAGAPADGRVADVRPRPRRGRPLPGVW